MHSRQEMIDDLMSCIEVFREKNPQSKQIITRSFYRSKGKIKEKDYEKEFGSFEAFKNAIDIAQSKVIESTKKVRQYTEEIAQLKRENEYLLKHSIREDGLIELYKTVLHQEFKYPIDTKRKDTSSNKDFVLNFCDLHLGEVVKLEEVSGANEFNKIIAIQRMDNLFAKLIKYANKIVVRDLYLEINGDLFHGGIHLENVRNSDINEVEAIFYLQRYLIPKLSELSNYFDHIYVDVIVGNHSRILPGKPYFKEKVSMNYEYIFGKQLKMYFDLLSEEKKNSKIFINVAESPFIIRQVRNTKFLVTHGDILTGAGSGGFAGIPFYSICMSSAKLYGVLHQIGMHETNQFDFILHGHLHTTCKTPLFNGNYAYGSGCICGTNEFSLYKTRSVARKEQLVLIVDEEGIDGEINIRL